MGKERQAVKMSWRRLSKRNYQFIQTRKVSPRLLDLGVNGRPERLRHLASHSFRAESAQ
jgi:hypothetical protein